MIKWAINAALLLNFYAQAQEASTGQVPIKPDPSLTTGDYCSKADPDFSEIRYKEKVAICARQVSWFTKDQIYKQYGVPEKCRGFYTVDHYIPLSMGGSNSQENLWPEHKDVKATRQNLEQQLYDKLKRGEISIEYALRLIVHAKRNPPHVVPRQCN